MGRLKEETFLPNDIIMKAGMIGDCMFFLARGTVAVFAVYGKEICHLEDGSYFGEVSLLMKDRKRVATVIALEICEIYKLDRKHFAHVFAKNPSFFYKIEKRANDRLEAVLQIDTMQKDFIVAQTKRLSSVVL